MSETNTALFDLLDKEIDDIKDLPSFAVPDTGVYKLLLSVGVKEINDKPVVEFSYEVREIVELADSTIEEAARAKAGDKFSVATFLKDNDGKDSEIGWGRLKEMAEPFQAHFGISNLKALVQAMMADPIAITAKVVKKQRKAKPGENKDADPVFDARVSDVTID